MANKIKILKVNEEMGRYKNKELHIHYKNDFVKKRPGYNNEYVEKIFSPIRAKVIFESLPDIAAYIRRNDSEYIFPDFENTEVSGLEKFVEEFVETEKPEDKKSKKRLQYNFERDGFFNDLSLADNVSKQFCKTQNIEEDFDFYFLIYFNDGFLNNFSDLYDEDLQDYKESVGHIDNLKFLSLEDIDKSELLQKLLKSFERRPFYKDEKLGIIKLKKENFIDFRDCVFYCIKFVQIFRLKNLDIFFEIIKIK